ncbi:Uncharacterised protein [Legionella wadsworthii]|uniref:Secreted protein n=1 Tax=Legionella wadsworthii TaxID=28088 RepID=A0A378LVI0_9GAMM|nr:hypothetical protein [Legionella wadsworthii]STY29849.1 Uncharacterised protein [Legionella wadsworthii]
MRRFNLALGVVAGMITGNSLAEPVMAKPIVIPEIKHDISKSLKEMALEVPKASEPKKHVVPLHIVPMKLPPVEKNFVDQALQTNIENSIVTIPGLSFLGLGLGYPGYIPNTTPPDTNAAVGLTQVVEWVNTDFVIFNKATGIAITAPTPGNALWAGFGGPCEEFNDGDPIVKYDQLANRWVFTQFAIGDKEHQTQCVAISITPDATGPYFRYAYDFGPTFNDYGKLAVWPDAYYMMFNMFTAESGPDNDLVAPLPFIPGPAACAMDRNSMLIGAPASIQCFQTQVDAGLFLPSDLDGHVPPPPGSPNYFIGLLKENGVTSMDHLAVWKFYVNWSNPLLSRFFGPLPLKVAPFNPKICEPSDGNAEGDCAMQPGTTAKLDVISDRPMYRLAYRNFGLHQSFVLNHNVQVGNQVPATRWYEIRINLLGRMSVHQQGTYMPYDGIGRWMGSIAMDKQGNIALGYSASSPFLFPSIRYTGRNFFDPRNIMRSENVIATGSASQLPSKPGEINRWGDYSSMALDPSDDCTFWYANEFIMSPESWSTMIASFKFPSCH